MKVKRIASFRSRTDAREAVNEIKRTGRLGRFGEVRILANPVRVANRWEFVIEVEE